MRKLTLLLATLLVATSTYAQSNTKARADQIVVSTNGMRYMTSKNLQTDLAAADYYLYLLNKYAVSPVQFSNEVATAISGQMSDFMSTLPDLLASTTPASFPTGGTLVVGNLVSSGIATAGSLRVTGALSVGGSPVYGNVDTTVATVAVPTNTSTSCITPLWLFPITTADTYLTTGSVVVTNGMLRTVLPGLYNISFSAAVAVPGGTSGWNAFIEVAQAGGTTRSNSCRGLYTPGGMTGFVGNATALLSTGASIRAFATFSGTPASAVGGGVLLVSRTDIHTAAGAVYTGAVPGGW